MELHKVAFAETNAFSQAFLDYIQGHPTLTPFYHRTPHLPQFEAQIKEKASAFPQQHRDVLVNTLRKQYGSLKLSEIVNENLTSLTHEKTFTITTGHQLNIFTGPLYFIYKIVTVINACKQLGQQHPGYRFVPVYWMASEDHDFDEIKYFRLYGKKYTWNSQQKGAVGRFNPKELKEVLDQVPGDTSVFRDAYLKYGTLADAVRHYVNALFGDEGLIVVDGDSRELKSLLAPVILDDLKNHTAKKLVEETNQQLEQLGYKTQVFARDVNFFYLDTQLRGRIEKADATASAREFFYGDDFVVTDSSIHFTGSEVEKLIQTEPERFSPNVILRPLYQEIILPNLAYVGGPAEVVYWLQLKRVFDHYQVPFPILMPRNFALVADGPNHRKFKKTKLSWAELFMEKQQLFKHYATRFAEHPIFLNGEKDAVMKHFEAIHKQAEGVDKTLGPLVSAETKRALRSLEKIEAKLLKAEKRFQSDKLQQIEAIKDALFPNGGLQERTDNFLNFYQQDPGFIKKLLERFDPFDYRVHVLCESAQD
jgi:bacillithiol biosynthesis cysteine-adding enzyme BshC